MTVDLRFVAAIGPQPGGAVRLVFGAVGDPVVADPPSANLVRAFSSTWAAAAHAAPVARTAPWRAAQPLGRAQVAGWSFTVPRAPQSWLVRWAVSTPLRPLMTAMPWSITQALPVRPVLAPWRKVDQLGRPILAPWAEGTHLQRPTLTTWQASTLTRRVVGLPWHPGTAMRAWVESHAGRGHQTTRAECAPWQAGIPLEAWGSPIAVVPATPPARCYTPPAGNAVTLLFRDQLTGLAALLFTCGRRAPIARIPVQRVYMITNTVSLVRVSDGQAVPCLGLTLNLDVDSWAWGWSASLAIQALPLIDPSSSGEPTELLATVNGTAFRLIAESVSRDRAFGQATVRVAGRGKTAVLDTPYSAVATFSNASSALTSQQLLDAALPSGWSAAWGLTAWTVPAGVWSHQGTPITAAVAIALAGGGYVQPEDTADGIRVLPRYPVAPWDWSGIWPDIELPASVATRESINWVKKPVYNRVFVSGTGQGVLGQVTRSGTAGDLVAQMITDPLITHVDAARQRGLVVLADTGRQAPVSLRLPVLDATGVIRPGKFVRYIDGSVTRIGLARSVRVDAVFPQVWQTISLETHID